MRLLKNMRLLTRLYGICIYIVHACVQTSVTSYCKEWNYITFSCSLCISEIISDIIIMCQSGQTKLIFCFTDFSPQSSDPAGR